MRCKGMSAIVLVLGWMSCLSCGDPDQQKKEEDMGSVAQEALVSSVSPADGAANVSLDAMIVVAFTKPMTWVDPAASPKLLVNPPVAGEAALSEDGKTLTWKPSRLFMGSTTYKVTLPVDVVESVAQKQRLREPLSFSFGTAAKATSLDSGTYRDDLSGDEMRVRALSNDAGLRDYEMSTTATLRDNDPPDKARRVQESMGQPVLRSGDVVFDALFAMSVQEARENSVSSISDYAFNDGNGVPCECFETGAKWNYVWTRDTAYAVDLGLAMLDPERARRSLEFKLSALKSGDGSTEQIVQDTGSGGSWPVSTDRVVWAIGAERLLPFLEEPVASAFEARMALALAHTAEQDRRVVFDPDDGLYRGEQSFLDWREQSYPSWTGQDTVHIAMSKTLSTNVGHLRMLRLLARLSQEPEKKARYEAWADELEVSIARHFWLEEEGTYSAMKLGPLAPHALRKYDLLGQSLLVLSDVGDEQRANAALRAYPRLEAGPPVLWPQQPLTRIYHNRGIWPFVTAYDLLAAREAGAAAIFELDLESLVRGAALNLSNMENFEMTTQSPYFEDGQYSGPVVNSRRQLWSVAGYFGAIVRGVFGVEMHEDETMTIAPFITSSMHERWFAGGEEARLEGIVWRGKRLNFRHVLPPLQGGAVLYEVKEVLLNGAVHPARIAYEELSSEEDNEIEVRLSVAGQIESGESAGRLVTDLSDYRELFAPNAPEITSLQREGDGIRLGFAPVEEQGVVYDVWRNGMRVATSLEETTWLDADAATPGQPTMCYTVHARFVTSGHHSNPSLARCFWGQQEGARIFEEPLVHFASAVGGAWSMMHGRSHYEGWGEPGDELEFHAWEPRRDGLHHLQWIYGNGAGSFETGITAAVKEVLLEDYWTGEVLDRGHAVMPHLADWARWGESSLVSFEVEAGRLYRVRLVDAVNMSYFEHFRSYTGGLGGGDGVYNRANIAGMKILEMGEGEKMSVNSLSLSLDGVDDLSEFALTQRYTPGAPLQSWSAWGVDWDERYLYVALVSQGFESEFKSAMIYMDTEGTLRPWNDVVQSSGVSYSGLEATLPFTPRYMVSVRRQQQGSSGEEPWSGVYEKREASEDWRRVWGMVPGEELWVAQDHHTIAWRVPWAVMGNPERIRLVGHLIHEEQGEEWKELLPAGHSPWGMGGGSYFEVDLDASDHAIESWVLKP